MLDIAVDAPLATGGLSSAAANVGQVYEILLGIPTIKSALDSACTA